MTKVKWPATESQLEEAGYRPPSNPTPMPCRACQTPIQFWMTPNAASIPLSQKDGALQPHFADCPKAASFKRQR